ncbi:UDP-glucuronosyltransferase 2B1 [Sigmodon hispidus]
MAPHYDLKLSELSEPTAGVSERQNQTLTRERHNQLNNSLQLLDEGDLEQCGSQCVYGLGRLQFTNHLSNDHTPPTQTFPAIEVEVADSDAPSLETSTTKMVNIPKTRRIFCKKCGKHQPHRVTQYKKDAVGPCGELQAVLLKTPLVYSLCFCPGYKCEKYGGGLPLPPSYVPVVLSKLKDYMTFVERVKNMLQVLYFDFWFEPFNEKTWSQFYSDVLGRPTTLYEIMGKADIWLIRTFWDLEFPHPFLPNFDFVLGLHCKPAKPLPKTCLAYLTDCEAVCIVAFVVMFIVTYAGAKFHMKQGQEVPRSQCGLVQHPLQTDLLSSPLHQV